MSRVEQTKRAHAVQALDGDVLQKSTKELVCRQRHALWPMVAAVSVTEGHGVVVARDDGLVAKRGAMDVATEVLKDALWTADCWLGEDDPVLVPGDVGKHGVRQRATRQAQETSAKVLSQRTHRH